MALKLMKKPTARAPTRSTQNHKVFPLTLAIDDPLREALEKRAKAHDASLSWICRQLLRKAIWPNGTPNE